MDNRPIGIFDSGVGGLSILLQLHRLLPQEDLVYFGDTARVPYGNHSPQVLRQYAQQDIDFLLSKGVKLVVAACGTVSSNMTPQMVAGLPVPYTGIIQPTAQAACQCTRNGVVGVIGTAATVQSGSFPRAMEAIRPGLTVVSNPCPQLIPLVEAGHTDPQDPLTRQVAADYLEPIRASGADTLVLGCTHFPLLYPLLNQLLGGRLTLVDPGVATAQQAAQLLQTHGLQAEETRTGQLHFYVSAEPQRFIATAEPFLGFPIGDRVRVLTAEEAAQMTKGGPATH